MKQTPYSTETVLWTEFLIQSGFDPAEALALRDADLAANPPTGVDLLQLKAAIGKVECWLQTQWSPIDATNPYFEDLRHQMFRSFLIFEGHRGPQGDTRSSQKICGALRVWVPESEIPLILPERYRRYPMPPGRCEQPSLPFVAEVLPGAYVAWKIAQNEGLLDAIKLHSDYDLPRPSFHRNVDEAIRRAQSFLTPSMSDRFVALTPESVDAQIANYEAEVWRLDRETREAGMENLRRALTGRGPGEIQPRGTTPIAPQTPAGLRQVRDEILQALIDLDLDDDGTISPHTTRVLYAMRREAQTFGADEDVEDPEDEDDDPYAPTTLGANPEDT